MNKLSDFLIGLGYAIVASTVTICGFIGLEQLFSKPLPKNDYYEVHLSSDDGLQDADGNYIIPAKLFKKEWVIKGTVKIFNGEMFVPYCIPESESHRTSTSIAFSESGYVRMNDVFSETAPCKDEFIRLRNPKLWKRYL